ncbi:MAG: hypothetical protein KKC68_05305 [Candidatus Thermoplasmatota archaeon]|nr:hypothetical protein [Candidatus Thermoplasmatota archaeon]MBU1941172.1 hypothetical protein [Candidatus Thermoplasmatota archaeon]
MPYNIVGVWHADGQGVPVTLCTAGVFGLGFDDVGKVSPRGFDGEGYGHWLTVFPGIKKDEKKLMDHHDLFHYDNGVGGIPSGNGG